MIILVIAFLIILEQTAPDVLYKTKTSNNKGFYIYCLIEHQSSACWDMPLRFLDYQVSILKSHKEQYPKQKSLPIVVTLLIYNKTKSPYPHTLNIFALFNDLQLAKQTFIDNLVYIIDKLDQDVK